MSGISIIRHTKYDRITNMERSLALIAVLVILWPSCKSDDKNKKKISISTVCCKNHKLMCKDRKTDEKELILCIHVELGMAQYAGNKTLCEEFQTFCGPRVSMQPVAPREATTMHSTSETDYAEQGPSIRNKDYDCENSTNGVSVPVVVFIAILMFLLGIVGMLMFTCFTYELWQRWKICGPFHSCLSHNTYIDTVPNKSHTSAATNKTMNNPTYHDPDVSNHSVESCIYDAPRDSIQADYNPVCSFGTQATTNSITEKQDGNKDSSYINPSQYELLNESENQDGREHRYSCIQSEPYKLDSSELTSGSASACTHNTEYQKVEGNHEYFEVETHSKVTTIS